MLRSFRTALAGCCLIFSGLAAAQDLPRELAQALPQSGGPALGAAILAQGQVRALHVVGLRAADSKEPALPQDAWNIGSNGKAITAVLIARLVEQGLLRWDARLEAMLPELAASMQPGYRGATLADLLSHQAGLPENVDEAWVESHYGDARPLPQQRAEYARLALSAPPLAPAPAPFSYSNSGSMIAAVIAERVTGKAYETLVVEQVGAPLGMRIGFGPTGRGQPLAHAEGKPQLGERAGNPLFFAPAGEMHLSLADWAKFALDQLAGERGGGKLLQAATYRRLHGGADGQGAMGWGVRLDFPAGAPQRMLMHGGSNGNWHALIALVPERELGVLLVANSGTAGAVQSALAQAWLKSLLGTSR